MPMDFQALQNEVSSQCHFDTSVAANLTLIKRWINRAQQYMCTQSDWSWLQSREIVQTVVDKNQDSPASSSVSVSSNGTTVTGDGTDFAATDVGRYIQFTEYSNDWYRITARASATSITIESGYNGTSAISGADYIIRTFYYSLSSSVDRIISVKEARTPKYLYPISPISHDRFMPFATTTSTTPEAYSCWGMDTSFNWVIQFYPWPSVAMNMEVRYLKALSDLSGNTDTGPIPGKLRDTVLLEGAIAYGYKHLNDERYREQFGIFRSAIEDAIAKDNQNRGAMTVLEATDAIRPNANIVRYPAYYPNTNES